MDPGYRSDILRGLVPFWLQQSVGALTQLVGRPLRWVTDHMGSQPGVPPGLLGLSDQVIVYVRGHESACRLWVVGWPPSTAIQLLRWLRMMDDQDRMPGPLSLILDRPARTSALLEAGNIMAGTFFTAVAGAMNQVLIPSAPEIIIDDSATCQARLRDLVAPEMGTWVVLVGRLLGEGLELSQWTAVFWVDRQMDR
ncbi:MAG: chemotaxis protein CheC [Acidobacteria bacterium]|nr:chemotaxis protein CheC [Acidobacteriota bacterium]MDW7983661.1 chemotaxis protein CheC [Acidobacteriota bacterium]